MKLTEVLPAEAQGERGYLVGRAAYEAGRIQRDLVPVAIRSEEQGWGLAVADS